MSEILTAIGVGFTVLTALLGVYYHLYSKITAMEIRLTRLETTLELYLRMSGSKAANVLHSPHTPELDALLEKFAADTLSPKDRPRFTELLRGVEANGSATKGERMAAVQVLLSLQLRKA